MPIFENNLALLAIPVVLILAILALHHFTKSR